ncbi:alkaline phosphatase D family protein [Paenarthrobacter sp. AB444]|uniref:alkaline phosphatase D family protein n=1 Tax=Paenarthrobacter sp. AB444 TaxID=3025681 RepID=UPI0023657188|nr:alkaline phosphatase D family protein [Paenarthrobacter sp. AB444]MDD7837028.1 alkaline phosphatase D family protein [Paenarthrobacter sp. AB444]
MTDFSRRTLVKSSLAGLTLTGLALGSATPAGAAPAAIPLVRRRLTLPTGIATGDVTTDSAVLWSRASGPGRLTATLNAIDDAGELLRGRYGFSRTIRGPLATEASDFTAKIHAKGLPPGTRFRLELNFEDENGTGEVGQGTFSTAPGGKPNDGGTKDGRGGGSPASSSQSFVWTGDTAGQGWGINEEIGGMRGYKAMHDVRPDFFIHSGDTIYADGPISASVTEKDGQVWRNIVTEEVSKVAETLKEFRGRHRYNSLDANMRAMFADVPVIAQWDDHETHNNWYPGQVLDDARYTERNVNVLAARGRQAWQENMPIADSAALWRPGTYDAGQYQPARIYRKIPRGPQLDIFCLDMRTYKSPNTDGKEPYTTNILGQEQVDWLIKEVRQSKATWKVIAADLPLGIVVPDGPVNQESLSNRDNGAPLGRELEIAGVLSAFKKYGVKNTVWLTADVHYCAAHHYSPERASFKDFQPFWEFVAGPINAGSFGPNDMDGTFGPDVVFSKAGRFPGESPRNGENQFFGHVELGSDNTFNVSLRNANGGVVFSKTLSPER